MILLLFRVTSLSCAQSRQLAIVRRQRGAFPTRKVASRLQVETHIRLDPQFAEQFAQHHQVVERVTLGGVQHHQVDLLEIVPTLGNPLRPRAQFLGCVAVVVTLGGAPPLPPLLAVATMQAHVGDGPSDPQFWPRKAPGAGDNRHSQPPPRTSQAPPPPRACPTPRGGIPLPASPLPRQSGPLPFLGKVDSHGFGETSRGTALERGPAYRLLAKASPTQTAAGTLPRRRRARES